MSSKYLALILSIQYFKLTRLTLLPPPRNSEALLTAMALDGGLCLVFRKLLSEVVMAGNEMFIVVLGKPD